MLFSQGASMSATSTKTIDRERVNLRSPAVRTLGVLALAAAGLVPLGAAAQAQQQFCNNTPITIPSSGPATPYPSTITVAGGPTSIASMQVLLNGLSHTWRGDVNILLAGPGGQNLVLTADAGGGTGFANANITFDDTASSQISLVAGDISGAVTYRAQGGSGGNFAAGTPALTGAANLAAFNGSNANGAWNLYVYDDIGGDSGSLASWCVSFAGSTPPATVAPVPTLGEWSLMLLTLAAAGLGARRLRRR